MSIHVHIEYGAMWHVSTIRGQKVPRLGFEPRTTRLKVSRSKTTELPGWTKICSAIRKPPYLDLLTTSIIVRNSNLRKDQPDENRTNICILPEEVLIKVPRRVAEIPSSDLLERLRTSGDTVEAREGAPRKAERTPSEHLAYNASVLPLTRTMEIDACTSKK